MNCVNITGVYCICSVYNDLVLCVVCVYACVCVCACVRVSERCKLPMYCVRNVMCACMYLHVLERAL